MSSPASALMALSHVLLCPGGHQSKSVLRLQWLSSTRLGRSSESTWEAAIKLLLLLLLPANTFVARGWAINGPEFWDSQMRVRERVEEEMLLNY
ncbi:hypothetical protein NDU88_002424 [Pleurodeles waltl]|uniref:Uncharacterized protein n=1 Tax=Pleurodeles waltl TaxID=8319 RepID=A0AAV7KS62_PLEWA|nr:hypothetical protein NDU88_002424 [Pleurodeles waltl]